MIFGKVNHSQKRGTSTIQSSAWKAKRKGKSISIPRVVLFISIIFLLFLSFIYINVVNSSSSTNDSHNNFLKPRSLRTGRSSNDKFNKISSKTIDARGSMDDDNGNSNMFKNIGDISSVIKYLMRLAKLPTSELQTKLEKEDIFQIQKLLNSCPFSSSSDYPVWLPPKTPQKKKDVFVWYEHISKAGGTSFCNLVQDNMKKSQYPPYYCMPRDPDVPNDPDGRVGRWSNAKLRTYMTTHPKVRLVSNEWQPFPVERFEFGNDMMTVTTIRNPLDRLKSAYKFWGILHNPIKNKPSFPLWLHRQIQRSEGKDPQDWIFAVHISRYNYITWKFSNGTMPQGMPVSSDPNIQSSSFPISNTKKDYWTKPFVEAITNLARLDLVLVLELMSTQHSTKMLQRTLGWTNFKHAHVVPSGQVENNHMEEDHKSHDGSSDGISHDEFIKLYDANRYDIILYQWMKAVHLVKLQCNS